MLHDSTATHSSSSTWKPLWRSNHRLDPNYEDEDRARAEVEWRDFEARQRREKEEAEKRHQEERRKRREVLRETWETAKMQAEEAEEQRRRAAQRASEREEFARKRWGRDLESRRRVSDREAQKASAQKAAERELKQKQRKERRLARHQERMRRMAESGYAYGPGGWVQIGSTVGTETVESLLKGLEDSDSSEDASGARSHNGSGVPENEVLDDAYDEEGIGTSQHEPESTAVQEHVIPSMEELLNRIRDCERQEWEEAAVAPPLEAVLEAVREDERQEEESLRAQELKEAFSAMGGEGSIETNEAVGQEARVLQIATTKRPGTDWMADIKEEPCLKPFNDFDEAKQEGANSFEERQARAAAIQAKLQAARNRMSLVRYSPQERRSTAPSRPSLTSSPATASSSHWQQEQHMQQQQQQHQHQQQQQQEQQQQQHRSLLAPPAAYPQALSPFSGASGASSARTTTTTASSTPSSSSMSSRSPWGGTNPPKIGGTSANRWPLTGGIEVD